MSMAEIGSSAASVRRRMRSGWSSAEARSRESMDSISLAFIKIDFYVRNIFYGGGRKGQEESCKGGSGEGFVGGVEGMSHGGGRRAPTRRAARARPELT